MDRLSLVVAFLLAAVHLSAPSCLDQTTYPDLNFYLSGYHLAWPCESTKNIYISAHRYKAENILANRAQILGNSAFVALPRHKHGNPITLGKITLKRGQCVTPIEPYPCWSEQEEGNCRALQSVVDLYLDPMDRLWVLDTGITNTLEQPVRRCGPKVVCIDTKTSKVVKVIDLSELVSQQSKLQHLVVDYDESGRAYVYVADAGTRSIISWDVTENVGHRVVLPAAVSAGCSSNDVLYIVLVRKSCGTTFLYCTFLDSTRVYFIKTSHLRQGQGSSAVVDVGEKPEGKKMILLGNDNGGALFFRYKNQGDIYLWNTETCFKPSNFLLVQKGGDCRLPTHVMPGSKKFMWVLESNTHHYVANTVGCTGASIVLHPVVKDCED